MKDPFSLDCIAVAIEYIDHPGTLFDLLTVSRGVFQLAVSRLYRDPFEFGSWSPRSALAFTHLVLSLSPVVDEDAQRLRHHLNVEYPPTTTPCADYLSLIRNFRSSPPMKSAAAWSAVAPPCNGKRLWPVLTYMAAAHRLPEVNHLTIPSEHEYSNFYTEMADQLTSLQQVTLEPTTCNDMARAYGFVQRYVDHFGAQGRRLRVQIRRIFDQRRDLVLETLSLLDPVCRQPESITRENVFHCIAQRGRVDFGHVSTIEWDLYGEEQTLSDILLKSHSLKSLNMSLSNSNVRVLGWSLDAAWSVQALSTAPPAPLESLTITGYSSAAMNALNGGLNTFGSSLEEVEVELTESPNDGMIKVHKIDPDLDLPSLCLLSVVSSVSNLYVTLQPDSMPVMPLLQTLVIDSQTKVLRSTANHCPPFTTWRPLHVPCLTRLHLSGRAAAEFNPASFHSMPRLRHLYLDVVYAYKDRWPADRWTWNWNLPLRSLVLKSLVATTFRISDIANLPQIEAVTLDMWEPWMKEESVLTVDHSLMKTDEELQSSSTTMPALSTTLEYLILRGQRMFISDALWQHMLGPWFPELHSLQCSGIKPGSNDLIESLRKRHPRLRKHFEKR